MGKPQHYDASNAPSALLPVELRTHCRDESGDVMAGGLCGFLDAAVQLRQQILQYVSGLQLVRQQLRLGLLTASHSFLGPNVRVWRLLSHRPAPHTPHLP